MEFYLSRPRNEVRVPLFSAKTLLVSFIAAAALTACAPTVLSTPNSCSGLIPSAWASGVPGAPLPDDDTTGSWIAFGDAQTGRLDNANGRTRDTLDIISKCEARDSAAVKRATRPWWKLF